MSGNGISDDDLVTLEASIRELTLGIRTYDARIDRLLGAAFQSHRIARAGLIRLLGNTSAERIGQIIASDGWKREWHFGASKDVWYAFWQRSHARQALHELPGVLLDYEVLVRRRQDLLTVLEQERSRFRGQSKPQPREQSRTRTLAHERSRGR